MIQAFMLTRHATCSITSRHSHASKCQDSTVKSVQALISYGSCSIMFTTNIAHGVRGIIASVPMKLSLYGALIKFSSDPFGESRATWFVFSFLPCYFSVKHTPYSWARARRRPTKARLAICTGPAAVVGLWRSFETLASTLESAAAELMEPGICATYSRVGAEFGLPRFKYTPH